MKLRIRKFIMLSTVNHNTSSNNPPVYLNKIIVWFAYMHDIGTANMQCQAKVQKVYHILKWLHWSILM